MKLITTLQTILFCVIILSCKKDFIEEPNLSGDLVGFVYTFDEYATVLDDHSNVTVSTKNQGSTSTIVTDARGRFEFKGLKAGTYDIEVKKDGFNSIKLYGIKHLGGEPTYIGWDLGSSIYPAVFFLYQKSTITFTNLTYRNDSLIGSLNFTTAEQPPFIRLIANFSENSEFSPNTAQLNTSIILILKNGIYSGKIFHENYPFIVGNKYYVSANVNFYNQGVPGMNNRSIIGNSSYYDYDTNQTIYPNLGNESAKYSFTVPK